MAAPIIIDCEPDETNYQTYNTSGTLPSIYMLYAKFIYK
jgi:hypothetical protein